MKYYEVKFSIKAPQAALQDVRDVLGAMAAEAGFETFEDTPEGLTGYVQQQLFDEPLLATLLEGLPFEGVEVHYTVDEAANEDWNQQWEEQGFEPIVAAGRCLIHDGRHVDPALMEQFPLNIEIDAHLAFGTGNHETTRLMVGALLGLDLRGCHVLDCGCGTGILGIAALKAGADRCTSYDIDEWSADNARHNAVINRVDSRMQVLLGDASVLAGLSQRFDVVLANINRNILLADLPAFVGVMKPQATLILSGFYVEDAPLLTAKAAQLGLHLHQQWADNQWACLAFHRS